MSRDRSGIAAVVGLGQWLEHELQGVRQSG